MPRPLPFAPLARPTARRPLTIEVEAMPSTYEQAHEAFVAGFGRRHSKARPDLDTASHEDVEPAAGRLDLRAAPPPVTGVQRRVATAGVIIVDLVTDRLWQRAMNADTQLELSRIGPGAGPFLPRQA